MLNQMLLMFLKLVQLHLLLRIRLRWRMRQVKLPSLMKCCAQNQILIQLRRQHGPKGCKIGLGCLQQHFLELEPVKLGKRMT